jgi:hypothetical protein
MYFNIDSGRLDSQLVGHRVVGGAALDNIMGSLRFASKSATNDKKKSSCTNSSVGLLSISATNDSKISPMLHISIEPPGKTS